MIFKKDIFTIPNLLSLLRLVLIPFYAFVYLKTNRNDLAAALLVLSCLTDLLDGFIARRYHSISDLGKFLDPLADKITQLTVILCLGARHALIKALIPLFLIKELLQSILAYIHFRNGKTLNGALWAGKISTAVLFVSTIILTAIPSPGNFLIRFSVLVDGFFLAISMISYLAAYLIHTSKLCDI